jgi:hypothetical protein
MSDAGGGVTYHYDARGRLASLVRQIASASYNLAIAYDARDRRLSCYDYDSSGAASVSYPDGGQGRPVGLRLNGSYLVQGAADNARENPLACRGATGRPRPGPTTGSTSGSPSPPTAGMACPIWCRPAG